MRYNAYLPKNQSYRVLKNMLKDSKDHVDINL